MAFQDEYRRGQHNFYWTLPRAMLAAFVLVLAIFLLLVVTTPLTIGFGWFRGEANLRSFGHVRQTYAEAFDDSVVGERVADHAASQRADGVLGTGFSFPTLGLIGQLPF